LKMRFTNRNSWVKGRGSDLRGEKRSQLRSSFKWARRKGQNIKGKVEPKRLSCKFNDGFERRGNRDDALKKWREA